MISIFQAVVLGILQGLAEFLPVSSSAHLALTPWIMGWEPPGLAFDVALHIGTLVAVLWYFRAELANLISAFFQILKTRRIQTIEQKRAMYLIVATVPAGVAGFLLEDIAESVFRSPLVIAWALIILGLILWLVDSRASMDRNLNQIKIMDAIAIGFAQVLALIPGVSRSGSTITAGRLLGLDRNSAAAFSFLMSVPVIGAAAVLKTPQLVSNGGLSLSLIAGIVASALAGVLAITVLLRYVSRRSYGVFAVYRVLLGVVMLALYYTRG